MPRLSEIPNSLHLPRPNWEAIHAWVEAKVPEAERRDAWTSIASDWMDVLRQALRGQYRIQSDGSFIVLAPDTEDLADTILSFASSAYVELTRVLGDLAGAKWFGPLAILHFADADTYYSYVSEFRPEGETGGSGGMCLHGGYLHIVIGPGSIDSIHLCTIHEMTHACLTDLTLPLWLEEGITQAAEAALHSYGQRELQSDATATLRRNWQQRGLQSFWWGTGFTAPGDEQQDSYRLASLLFHLIRTDYRAGFKDFVRHAVSYDAGESAARKYLGTDLSSVAATFLGKGNWEPVPPDSEAYCWRGWFYSTTGDHERALADLDRAIELDPKRPSAFACRGEVLYQIKRYEAATRDCETAIALDPRDSAARNQLAWQLATCPEEKFRNGPRALELASEACESTGYDAWHCLGTLAAACAEAGDFEEAIHWAREALRLAPPDEREGCKDRLRLYKRSTPYREEPVPSWNPPRSFAGGLRSQR